VKWPAPASRLREAAREDFAPDQVLELLDRLADGAVFDTVADVWEAAGGTIEHRD